MKKLVELSNEEASRHFLKGSSYFNADMPSYVSFEPILKDVATVLNGGNYTALTSANPNDFSGVNYDFLSNKYGKFAWRPLELIHPAIYVSLVNVICDANNWTNLKKRLSELEGGVVECCSAPVMSLDNQTDAAAQVRN
ncbi:MAG: hypothetical protein ACLP05_11325 [Candidatus Kryptoniota bacterium]